jgi:hypothetical protein
MACSPAIAAVANQVAELAKRSPYGAARMAADGIIGALWDALPKATRTQAQATVRAGEGSAEHLRCAIDAVAAMAQAVRDRL